MAIRKGDKATGFALPAKPGEMIDLGKDIGTNQTVLLFFPFAFSSVCSDEMCQMRDNWDDWKKLDAKVYGISVDSPFTTNKFREELNIPFPILSDFNKDVSKQYGALEDELMGLRGVSKRAAFVIGKDGIVDYAWVSDDAKQMPKFEEIQQALKA